MRSENEIKEFYNKLNDELPAFAKKAKEGDFLLVLALQNRLQILEWVLDIKAVAKNPVRANNAHSQV